MSTINHNGAVYTGLEAERTALPTAGLKKGTVWVETDTDAVHFWTGAIWACGGPSTLWEEGGVSELQPFETFWDVRIGQITDNDEAVPGYGQRLYFSGGPSWVPWDSENSDPLWIARYNVANDETELHINIGDNEAVVDALVIGCSPLDVWTPLYRFEMVRQAHIINADGTLADITAKFNTLLAELEAQGIVSDV